MHRTWTAREKAWAYGIPPDLVGMKHVVEAKLIRLLGWVPVHS